MGVDKSSDHKSSRHTTSGARKSIRSRSVSAVSGSAVRVRVRGSCDNFLYEKLQGRTFGAPVLTAPAGNGEAGASSREGKRPGWPAVGGRGPPGGLAVAGGPLRRVLRTLVLRRGGSPRTAPQVTDRSRSSPYPAAAPASTTARPPPCARRADHREDVIVTGPERRALSGLAPPASRAPEDRF